MKSNFNIVLSRDDALNFFTSHFGDKEPEESFEDLLNLINSKKDLKKFVNALHIERTFRKHVKIINPLKSTTGKLINKVVAVANNFCKQYELKKSEGYSEFIRIGMDRMGKKYRLNKFLYLEEKIFDKYYSEITVKNTPHLGLATKIYNYYNLKAGVVQGMGEDFIHCAHLVHKNNWNFAEFIDAQIKHMSDKYDVFPEPYNLHTDNAVLRMNAYIKNNKSNASDLTDFVK